jgi:hypothetical protein
MRGSSTSKVQSEVFPPILLCLPSDQEGLARLLEDRVFGQPLLLHNIQRLREIGGQTLLIAVDAVPGGLLSLVDQLNQKGVDTKTVRSVSEILTNLADHPHIVMVKADVIVDGDLLRFVAKSGKNILITVEENAENAVFERIDLNNRWTGIACLNHQLLSAIGNLPEGWDLGSSLLRQALQQQVECKQLRQPDVAAGQILNLAKVTKDDPFFPTDFSVPGKTESWIFDNVTRKFANKFWSTPIAYNMSLWLFPGLGIFAAILSLMGYFIPAVALAGLAILAADVRTFINAAEYQPRRLDIPLVIGWVLLVMTLAIGLYHSRELMFDAIFQSILIAGLAWLSYKFVGKIIVSPILLAMIFFVASIMAMLAIIVKLTVIVQLAVLGLSKKY